MTHSWIWACWIRDCSHFGLKDFDLLPNALVAMITPCSCRPTEAPLSAIGVNYQPSSKPTNISTQGTGIHSSYGNDQSCPGEWHVVCQSVASLPSPPFSFCLSVSVPVFFPHSLAPSFPVFWHGHFHLLPRGFEMSLQEVLVCLSGSSRALWLWQTSFNWEEARRVWKNWNIHETPFIRHNLNSAWKKPYMYKEKSTPLLLWALPSSASASPSPGKDRFLRDSVFSHFSKCRSRFVLHGWLGRKGRQILLGLSQPNRSTVRTKLEGDHSPCVCLNPDLPQACRKVGRTTGEKGKTLPWLRILGSHHPPLLQVVFSQKTHFWDQRLPGEKCLGQEILSLWLHR